MIKHKPPGSWNSEGLRPIERWIINGFKFETWCQRTIPQEEYAVKCISPNGEEIWLKAPEDRFETVSGARMSILMFLEDVGAS